MLAYRIFDEGSLELLNFGLYEVTSSGWMSDRLGAAGACAKHDNNASNATTSALKIPENLRR